MVKKATHSEFKRLNPSKVAAKYMSIPMASPDGLGLFVTPSPGCIWLISLISHEVRFQRGKKQKFKLNIPIQIALNVLTPASPSDIQTGTAEVLMSLIQLNRERLDDKEEQGSREAPGDLRHRATCPTLASQKSCEGLKHWNFSSTLTRGSLGCIYSLAAGGSVGWEGRQSSHPLINRRPYKVVREEHTS